MKILGLFMKETCGSVWKKRFNLCGLPTKNKQFLVHPGVKGQVQKFFPKAEVMFEPLHHLLNIFN